MGNRCLLAPGVQDVSCLAVDANYVYFVGTNRMGRIPKIGGGAPAQSTLSGATFAGCVQVANQILAADSGGGRIAALSKANPAGGIATLVSGEGNPTSLAVPVANQLVWNTGADLLRQCDPTSCTSTVMNLITGPQQPTQVAADNVFVFFATSGSVEIRRVVRTGGQPATIIGLGAPVSTLVAPEGSTDLFFTTDTAVGAVPKANANAVSVATGRKSPRSVRADTMNAFWVDRDQLGTVSRAPRAGMGQVTNLVMTDTPTALEIEGTSTQGFVYYAAKDGISRIPKQ
jgi:hypothetical protein